jgi:hypothetical protein
MKATLEKISELHRLGIFERYAIGGGIAHFYYIEAGTTYDLDVMISMNVQASTILSLEPLYDWAKQSGYGISEEHIIIEGIPVQFLPSFNAIISEAIETADQVEIFGVKTFIMKPEYLMVIMLNTNREKDRERLIKFILQSGYSETLFQNLLKKFNLIDTFNAFNARYGE